MELNDARYGEPVLLALTRGSPSPTVVRKAATLAGEGLVLVLGVASGADPEGSGAEQARRGVALAMSALQTAGVAARGQVAVSGSPVRVLVRAARQRGVRAVVLDLGTGRATPDMAPVIADLRRRLYGSRIPVMVTSR